MRFPATQRVVYRRTSLVEVICQLRFPPILRIDRDPPVEMQEALRSSLPGYNKKQLGSVSGGFVMAGTHPLALPAQSEDRRTEHVFLSGDGRERVSLGREFIALSTERYERWEEYVANLRQAFDALCNAYSPAHFTRVGLRYQNVIQRSALGLDSVPWRTLLKRELVGLLAEEGSVPRPVRVAHRAEYELEPPPMRARITHGLVNVEGSNEEAYLVDSDFFVERSLSSEEVWPWLEDLHTQAREFFQWCVEPTLHEAMEPEESP